MLKCGKNMDSSDHETSFNLLISMREREREINQCILYFTNKHNRKIEQNHIILNILIRSFPK